MEREEKVQPGDGKTALADDRIRFLEGRPERDRAIQADEIINLTIALNTARTLQEFLELV